MATTKAPMTAHEFHKSGPETDGYELIRGELIPMPPPTSRHGLICATVSFILKSYTKRIGRGFVVCNDAGLITEKNPDTVRGVDVALFLDPQWPGNVFPEGYTDLPPDLAVEVRSPSQSWREVVAKVSEYLAMGARLVWVIDPKVRRVTVFSPDHEPQTLAAENELDGGLVLPSFGCQVAEFFEGM